MAMARATGKLNADNLSVPLLDKGDGEEKKVGCFSFSCCSKYIVGMIISAGWAYEFVTYGGGALLFGAILGIIFNLFAAWVSVALARVASVNQSNNQVRGVINEQFGRNEKMSGFNDNLEQETAKLEELDQQLKLIAETQGSNVEQLSGLVKRNKEALKDMSRLTKAELAHKLVELIIDGDKDGDFIIDDDEAQLLSIRLNNFRSYIKVNDTNFKKAIKEAEGKLPGVMNIVKEITEENLNIPEKDRIFIFDESLGQRGSTRRSGGKRKTYPKK